MTTFDEAIGEIGARILHKAVQAAGLTPEQVGELPSNPRYAAGDQPWEVRQKSPVPGLVVYAIFEGDTRDPLGTHLRGDVRIFCIPDPSIAPNPMPYARVTLSRVGPTFVRTAFKDEDAFAKEVGEEWMGLAEALGVVDNDDEDEGEPCTKCGHFTSVEDPEDDQDDEEYEPPSPKFCGACGAAMTVTQ